MYRRLGQKLDGLTVRSPWSPALRAILEELYPREDAELIVAMPFGLSSLSRLERVTGLPRDRLEPRLDDLCGRGLVMDIRAGGPAARKCACRPPSVARSVVALRQVADRVEETLDVEYESHQHAGRQRVAQHQPSTYANHERGCQRSDEIHTGKNSAVNHAAPTLASKNEWFRSSKWP